MGFETEVSPEDTRDTEMLAARLRQETERQTQQLRSTLPTNRELIKKIHQYGLQPV